MSPLWLYFLSGHDPNEERWRKSSSRPFLLTHCSYSICGLRVSCPSPDPRVVIEVKTIKEEDFLEIFSRSGKNYPITFMLHIASHEWYTFTPAWLEQWERRRDIFNDFTISQRPVQTLLSSGKRAQTLGRRNIPFSPSITTLFSPIPPERQHFFLPSCHILLSQDAKISSPLPNL